MERRHLEQADRQLLRAGAYCPPERRIALMSAADDSGLKSLLRQLKVT
jgi:hypothetical protein